MASATSLVLRSGHNYNYDQQSLEKAGTPELLTALSSEDRECRYRSLYLLFSFFQVKLAKQREPLKYCESSESGYIQKAMGALLSRFATIDQIDEEEQKIFLKAVSFGTDCLLLDFKESRMVSEEFFTKSFENLKTLKRREGGEVDLNIRYVTEWSKKIGIEKERGVALESLRNLSDSLDKEDEGEIYRGPALWREAVHEIRRLGQQIIYPSPSFSSLKVMEKLIRFVLREVGKRTTENLPWPLLVGAAQTYKDIILHQKDKEDQCSLQNLYQSILSLEPAKPGLMTLLSLAKGTVAYPKVESGVVEAVLQLLEEISESTFERETTKLFEEGLVTLAASLDSEEIREELKVKLQEGRFNYVREALQTQGTMWSKRIAYEEKQLEQKKKQNRTPEELELIEARFEELKVEKEQLERLSADYAFALHLQDIEDVEEKKTKQKNLPTGEDLANEAKQAGLAAEAKFRKAVKKVDNLYDPITGELFEDPVTTPAGYTYDRKVIVRCIQTDGKDPLTQEQLAEEDLKPNEEVKKRLLDGEILDKTRSFKPAGYAIHAQLFHALKGNNFESNFPTLLKGIRDGGHPTRFVDLKTGDTALHLAARHSIVEFFRYLLFLIGQEGIENLKKENKKGQTPISIAIERGFEFIQAIMVIYPKIKLEGAIKAFHKAIEKGEFEKIEFFLHHGQDVNETLNPEQTTPLQTALKAGQFKIARYLLTSGANASEEDMYSAIQKGDLKALEVLFEQETDFAEYERKGKSKNHPLAVAISLNQFDSARFLINKGANVKIYTILKIFDQAVLDSDLDKAAFFLEQGVDPNRLIEEQGPVLFVAILKSYFKLAELLLTRGAKIEELYQGKTALQQAILDKDEEKIEFLLDHGASTTTKGAFGDTPLHCAAFVGLEKYISRFATPELVNARGERNRTPLLSLASGNNNTPETDIAICNALCERNADVHATDQDSNGALHLAARKGNRELIGYFLSKGLDPTKPNREGAFPSSIAAEFGHSDLALFLLDKTPSTRVQVLDAAVKRGDLKVVSKIAKEDNRVERPQLEGAYYSDEECQRLIDLAACSGRGDVIYFFMNDRDLFQEERIQTPERMRAGNRINRMPIGYKERVLKIWQPKWFDFIKSLLHKVLDISKEAFSQGVSREEYAKTALTILKQLLRLTPSDDINPNELLQKAVLRGHHEMIKPLCDPPWRAERGEINRLPVQGVADDLSVSQHSSKEPPVLWRLFKEMDDQTLEVLLEQGADPKWKYPHTGNTVLHIAVKEGLEGKCKILLRYYLENEGRVQPALRGVNLQNRAGETPLHLAVLHHQNISIIEALLAQKPILTIKNKKGWDPLSAMALSCSEYVFVKIAPLLFQAGADPNVRVGQGTLIEQVIFLILQQHRGAVTILRTLLEHGAKVDQMQNEPVRIILSQLEKDRKLAGTQEFSRASGNVGEAIRLLMEYGAHFKRSWLRGNLMGRKEERQAYREILGGDPIFSLPFKTPLEKTDQNTITPELVKYYSDSKIDLERAKEYFGKIYSTEGSIPSVMKALEMIDAALKAIDSNPSISSVRLL